MLEKPIITLTTDFGLKDPFVGLMKGVILGINPNAEVIDITHNIQRHNLFEAAQVISMSYKYFPPSTIHVVVVDPGVGGMRRPLLIVTEDHYFIGPDNGIFTPVFEASRTHFFKVIQISAKHYYRPMSGSTFHGRDIFSPVAAYLSKGTESANFGEQVNDFTKIEIPKPVITNENTIYGEIVSVDNFGNAISNITSEDISNLLTLEEKGKLRITYNEHQCSMVTHYSESKSKALSSIINSFGHLELFVYEDSAAETYNIKIRDSVSVALI